MKLLKQLLVFITILAIINCDTTTISDTCEDDVKVCLDGTTVGRDANNNCEFSPCKVVCTLDTKRCPDGSVVGRDVKNNCEFLACPGETKAPSESNSETPQQSSSENPQQSSSENPQQSSSETPQQSSSEIHQESSSETPEESSSEIPEEYSSETPEESSSEIPEESSSETPEESSSEIPEESSSEIPEEYSSETPEESSSEIPVSSETREDDCISGDCPTGHTIPEPIVDLCEQDAKDCGNGIYVGRDVDKNCQHFNCLNSSDCIYGTKRFGGYCACWSGAFGKNCTMGSAKVGTGLGAIINNAFSTKIRAISDMYYELDFDLMLGKSFLRNFTDHPSCPNNQWEKVYLLETNGVPRLDSAEFASGTLSLQVSQNMVDGRADGAVFLNNDDVDSGMHVDCYYPRSNYIEKLVQGCRDTWKFSIPWNISKTCGWKINSEETHVVYRGQVIIHNMEWLTIKQWRIIRSVLRLKIRFQRFIRVECDTKIFNEHIKQAAITRQIVAIELGQPALVELTTILNYPYKLYNGNLTLYPFNNISKFEFSSIDCTSTEGQECAQSWRTNLYMEEHACRLDGDYAMNFTLGCSENIADSDCTIPHSNLTDTRIEYRLRSEDFCAEIQVDIGIYGYILCFLDNNYSQHNEIYTVGQKVYLLIKINSDINPRNGSGALDANFYDESKAIIKFSSVSLVTITVRSGSGEVIRLLEKGKPCPDVFGVGLIIESKYGDGKSFSSNAVAFSFTLTRSLLSLKQNAKTKITIGAEVEAQYSDSSSKRMYLATNTDKSTFSTSPEVQDGNGVQDQKDTESSSLGLIVSFFLMVLAFLF